MNILVLIQLTALRHPPWLLYPSVTSCISHYCIFSIITYSQLHCTNRLWMITILKDNLFKRSYQKYTSTKLEKIDKKVLQGRTFNYF